MLGPLSRGAARRGSYDGNLYTKNPLRALAQRRCSAPSPGLGKTLCNPWSSTRGSLARAISVIQCPFALGLSQDNAEPILSDPVLLTRGTKTKERHLFLFKHGLVIAKLKSGMSFNLKHRLPLHELWVMSCEKEEEEKQKEWNGDYEFRPKPGTSLIFIWPTGNCIAGFCSAEVKELWLKTLRGQSQETSRGVKFITDQSAQALMKVLSGCNASKTLNANDMETLIECQPEGDVKQHHLLAQCDSEDGICHLIENKKRKVIAWPFPMRRAASSSDSSGSLTPEWKASLFDQPLSAICSDEDILPQPIQEILNILQNKGPSTEGIFRKAANEKARKELKEELNSGAMVNLETKSVHLLAAVLKDFLRSIPLKLLSSDLFEEWMTALEKPNEDDKIESLKQVAKKLPRTNILLLKHLVYVLYNISKNSDVSKMDSSNLAICIGPNMLSLDTDQSLSFDAQKELNNKIKTLVEFFIDNCFEIFEEDIPGHSPRFNSDDSLEHINNSDMSTLQNDSAYESTDADTECSNSFGSQYKSSPDTAELAGDLDNRKHLYESRPGSVVSYTNLLKSSLSTQERRYSEPSTPSTKDCLESRITSQKLTKSEDNFTVPQASSCFGSQETKESFPEECFPSLQHRKQKSSGLQIKEGTLCTESLVEPSPKTSSCGSLDSSSDSSVFANSPVVSPSSPKRNFFTRHQSFTTKTAGADSKLTRDRKKHSMSFSFATHKKVPNKTPSWRFPRDQGKKDLKKESQLTGRIVQESCAGAIVDYQPTPECASSRSHLLSVEEVFQLVDQKNPGSPPSYEEAVQYCRISKIPPYESRTVQSMRDTILSQNSRLPSLSLLNYGEHTKNTHCRETLHRDSASSVGETWVQSGASNVSTGKKGQIPKSEVHRLRVLSESLLKNKQDYVIGRCSQPIFEVDQIQYAKESYV
ncbi:T-cell activation Rho GTPase-activating protein [Gracilinanus agilis]|uniref:T-cell activation Rho GTPase-activating protein n=1 Tax=Gracilinanus agilis TaxID=191870 RepID=UPI001CFCD8F7|nr:T-cell activation Rho GTPase-activating protein [Gracilinanus agilis]